MDCKEEKTAKSQIEDHEATNSGETVKINEVIITPKVVTIDNHSNIESPAVEIMRNEPVREATAIIIIELTEEKFKCRPVAFLLGLPFALISVVIAFVGGIIWIIGLMLTCLCPCCFCVTLLPTVSAELALSLVNAPFAFFQYITDKIPF
ncbi:uncharacterized protein LOC132047748 [Lycium ferocissimum]|uniref:uncharacterized protein LOC132047748 n=1 Tax=Lycium ferocissimum TaxID=112874 RepID=UPI0028163BFA|nr:uncharacterized protein LOC132047748 [Lycium ferocissimum]